MLKRLKPFEYFKPSSLAEALQLLVEHDAHARVLAGGTDLVETSPFVRELCPFLSQAAGQVGSVQVRNRATIGGNLCNAAPSAETAPALLCLDARVKIVSLDGERVVSLEEFFQGPGITVLDGEILTAIQISPARWRGIYIKHSPRRAMDIAVVGGYC